MKLCDGAALGRLWLADEGSDVISSEYWVWAGFLFGTSAFFKSDLGKLETVQQRGMQ